MPELLRTGGLVALVASIFDMLDGRVARLRGRETKFGAFLDSTMDRYSDMVLYMGLLILYARLRSDAAHGARLGGRLRQLHDLVRARARGEPDPALHGRASWSGRSASCLLILGALTNRMVARAVDHRRPLERDRDPARRLHLRGAQEGLGARARGGPAVRMPTGVAVIFDGRADALRLRLLKPWNFKAYLWRKLPLAACAGLSLRQLDESGCAVALPGGWRTQNPFRSTYFAAQAMAAEMSTGAPAMMLVQGAPASIAMILRGIEAVFTKRIQGPSVFTFDDLAGHAGGHRRAPAPAARARATPARRSGAVRTARRPRSSRDLVVQAAVVTRRGPALVGLRRRGRPEPPHGPRQGAAALERRDAARPRHRSPARGVPRGAHPVRSGPPLRGSRAARGRRRDRGRRPARGSRDRPRRGRAPVRAAARRRHTLRDRRRCSRACAMRSAGGTPPSPSSPPGAEPLCAAYAATCAACRPGGARRAATRKMTSFWPRVRVRSAGRRRPRAVRPERAARSGTSTIPPNTTPPSRLPRPRADNP